MAQEVDISVVADTTQAINNVSSLRSRIQKISMAVAVVGGAFAGLAAGAAKWGDEFKVAERNIIQGTGATGDALDDLQESMRAVFREVPQDANAVSNAIADVNTKFGLTGDELESLTKRFLDYGRITGKETTPMVMAISDAMDIFGRDVSEASGTLDMFTKAAQVSGVPFEMLTKNVRTFGPVLKNLGMSLEESTALMANLRGAGIDVTRVMPAINASMRRMAASGVTDMREALETSMRAIKDTEDQTQALNMATELFGAEGAQRMLVAIKDGTVEIDAMTETLENSAGAVDDMNSKTLTSEERWDIFKNKVKDTISPLTGLFSAIGPILIVIPTLISGISGLTALLSMQAISTALATAGTWLLNASLAALNVLLSPITLIILALGAAIVAGILIWKNWDAIMSTVKETLYKIDRFLMDTFGPTWIYIKGVVKNAIDSIKEIFSGLWALFTGDLDGAKEHFSNALDSLKVAWDLFVSGLWAPFDDFMTNKFGKAWTGTKETVQTAIDTIVGIFEGLLTSLQGVWDLIVGIFTGDTDKIKEGFKGIVNGIIQMFNSVITMFNGINIKIPEWVPKFGGKGFTFNIPEIPQLAEGGIVNSPTLAMIGERGPEAVIPLNKSGAGATNVTVNVTMPDGGTVILDDESTAQRFGDFITNQIREALRTQGAF